MRREETRMKFSATELRWACFVWLLVGVLIGMFIVKSTLICHF